MGHTGLVIFPTYDIHPNPPSQENYLLKYRLRWGQPDRLSVLKPYKGSIDEIPILNDLDSLPIPTVDYFRADTPPHLISVIVNDWPYSGMTCSSLVKLSSLTPPTQFHLRLSTMSFGPANPYFIQRLFYLRSLGT